MCFVIVCSFVFFFFLLFFFFFNATATTEIYTLSLHDALPISGAPGLRRRTPSTLALVERRRVSCTGRAGTLRSCRIAFSAQASLRRDIDRLFSLESDRKSTRLNSSHRCISYAVFCLKKKKWALKYDTSLCSAPVIMTLNATSPTLAL